MKKPYTKPVQGTQTVQPYKSGREAFQVSTYNGDSWLIKMCASDQIYATKQAELKRALEFKTFRFEFTGREKNAIGITYKIIKEVIALDIEKARLKLYDNYEQIMVIKCDKV